MNHEEVCKIIAEGLDLERNSPKCRAVKAHLESCSDCRGYLSSLKQTIESYRSYTVEVPVKAHELLEEVLKNLPTK